MNGFWSVPPFLPGFDPSQTWPAENYQALVEAARSGEAIALWGSSGAAFASAVWVLHRTQLQSGRAVRHVDLSHLSNPDRLRAWESPVPEHTLDWMEHAELIPVARRASGARMGRVVSFVTDESSRPVLSGGWRFVQVPPLRRWRRVEYALQTAWRSLTGNPLPKTILTALVSSQEKFEADGLECLMAEAAPKGREYLSKRLESWLDAGSESSLWKKRKLLLEKTLLKEALQKSGGNRTRAAKELGVHRNTVLWHLRKMKKQMK